jgi:hypothetical protein
MMQAGLRGSKIVPSAYKIDATKIEDPVKAEHFNKDEIPLLAQGCEELRMAWSAIADWAKRLPGGTFVETNLFEQLNRYLAMSVILVDEVQGYITASEVGWNEPLFAQYQFRIRALVVRTALLWKIANL